MTTDEMRNQNGGGYSVSTPAYREAVRLGQLPMAPDDKMKFYALMSYFFEQMRKNPAPAGLMPVV